MAMYVFYLRPTHGASTGFEAFELASDRHAVDKAAWLLTQHPSASHVVAWQGDRQIVLPESLATADEAARAPSTEETLRKTRATLAKSFELLRETAPRGSGGMASFGPAAGETRR